MPKNKKGDYRIASASDPDATFRVHAERVDFGYNASVAATNSFIGEIRVDTGSQPDQVDQVSRGQTQLVAPLMP